MEKYPKVAKIKDGTNVVIQPLGRDDGPALLELFRALPADDRLFLKEGVTKQEVINRWIAELDYNRVLPIIAERDSPVIGDATLHINTCGWHRHMAEIRSVVAVRLSKEGSWHNSHAGIPIPCDLQGRGHD